MRFSLVSSILMLVGLAASKALGPRPAVESVPAVDISLLSPRLPQPTVAYLPEHATPVRRWGRAPPAPATNDYMNHVVCKGINFLDAFPDTDEGAGSLWKPKLPSAHSSYTWPDLGAWGYNIYLCDPHGRDFTSNNLGLDRALRELGMSDKATEEGGRIRCLHVHHGDIMARYPHNNQRIPEDVQSYRGPDNRVRRVTGAYFVIGINADEGAIFTINVKGPSYTAPERFPPVPFDQLPNLRASSDVMWGLWKRYAPANTINNLKWYFVVGIVNDPTRSVLIRAMNELNEELKPYPGTWIGMDTVYGQAILGTPNAVGLGYFLAQHKPELGNLRVTGVVVFHGDTETKLPCLAFHVQPVPEDENKKDPDDPQGPGGNHPADWVGPVPPSLEVLGGCEGDQEHIDGSCSVSR
ncbi:hypothetical protein BU26DRAFT_12892 [Trematosphaeria pertusa]|uniref:Uncharacterized protein n=1 Tax=Trematosphaeria pertusa TaxID=390896 RepID=A0A6A6J0E9_9PLEO|nr:uncharacterized protein BU26DRAFT_12892 [Trematosphaeria pertusa]KAF2255978.1 hypothetical protein BU26DRAFT_12892 [Trematosphaeria pertusa]